ncbi:unnamed protein product [Adineta steineri]|uniref:ADP/ATP translocase n=1 Tax=Adineta steineri TaxID=433720 RepID=A0A815N687_9BILA|nr:unnamed protein product [Adineta steineri]CAF1624792.1 unnamed protein product [Adineta steineri]
MFKQNKNHSHMVNFAKNIAIGSTAGVLSLCFVYPLDYARTRLANDVISTKKGGGKRKYKGPVDVYKKTLATDGIAGLYRGFVISCVETSIYCGCVFGFYDTFKPILVGPNDNITLLFSLYFGIIVTSYFISYPVDTIRRRMMMTSGEAVKYKGSMNCMFQILRTEGVMAFYKGASINILRGLASASVILALKRLGQSHAGIKADPSASD